ICCKKYKAFLNTAGAASCRVFLFFAVKKPGRKGRRKPPKNRACTLQERSKYGMIKGPSYSHMKENIHGNISV
ncbi:MAG: hypothetical protein IJP03_01760, partial [Christensenellaceae bacterium]|nr:hypothetical protein [Christensenellaceae bacterium]